MSENPSFYSAKWEEFTGQRWSGIYHASIGGRIMYIGASAKVARRIRGHRQSPWFRLCVSMGAEVEWKCHPYFAPRGVNPSVGILILENWYICEVRPPLNCSPETPILKRQLASWA